MSNHIKDRRETYYKLNSRLSELDNKQLVSLFRNTKETRGWSRQHTIKLAKSKIFVKRLPVTEVEYDHMFSTKNLYGLPTYYNYGVGSAGLGVFREIIANIKTTNWVLDGSIEYFPLMYHYRIVPSSVKNPEMDTERHDKYVRYWNNNKNIGQYMIDRGNAK